MPPAVRALARLFLEALRDLAPIVLVVAFFQLAVLQKPFPDLDKLIPGLVCVVLGMVLFVRGLQTALFPLGEALAESFARRGSLVALLIFAFGIGFGTTIAEPALIAIGNEAAVAASDAGFIAATDAARESYALGLRLTVGLSVGVALVIGVFRILKGWPIHHFILVGYVLVVIVTQFAPPEIIGIAYDSGGVTTSTITVPLVTALGVGLA